MNSSQDTVEYKNVGNPERNTLLCLGLQSVKMEKLPRQRSDETRPKLANVSAALDSSHTTFSKRSKSFQSTRYLPARIVCKIVLRSTRLVTTDIRIQMCPIKHSNVVQVLVGTNERDYENSL